MRGNSKVVLLVLILAGAATSCLTNDIVSPANQLKADTDSIRSYLSRNNLSAIETTEGVWYHLDNDTLTPLPALSDSVKISFITWWLKNSSTKKKVDSSATATSATRTVLLSSVISGMQAGLSRFPVGGRGELYVPSGLAFGVAGYVGIPSNANLLYEINLVSATGSRLASDKATVESYVTSISGNLLASKDTLVRDPSGVRYSYDTIYADSLSPKNKMRMSYKVSILNSSTFFINSSDTIVNLSEEVTAFKIVMPKIRVGTTVTLYVPSGYAYGNVPPKKGVPANSNLTYTIKLKEVY